MSNKIALYTAIYGNKDTLNPAPKIDGVDTILFTDSVFEDSKGWIVKQISGQYKSNNLNAKQYKILPHIFLSNYDSTIWVDGNFNFKNVEQFIKDYDNKDMTVFDHQSSADCRNCIYKEAIAVINLQKDKANVVEKQINKYKKEYYPPNNGLICGGIMFRKNIKDVNILMDYWWDEIINGSIRDQISFNYSAWKNNFEPHYIKKDIRNNEYFIFNRHKK